MKKFTVVTIFPETIETYANLGMFRRAHAKKIVTLKAINPRDFSPDARGTVDGRPYGGGPGMVMQALPILKAVEKAKGKNKAKIFILSPRGKQFDSVWAQKLAKTKEDIIFIAGRYEGIDARIKKILKAEEISVGPYILSGGELPALVIIEAISRFLPEFLGKEESIEENRLAPPEQYTRPEELIYKKKKYCVPKVLLSGNHKKIREFWEKELKKKGKNRPLI